jgi:hypothetical protein
MENPPRWATRAVFISVIAQLQLPTKTTFDGTNPPVVMRRPETTTYGMKLLFSADGGQSKSRASESDLVVIDLDKRAQAPDFCVASP